MLITGSYTLFSVTDDKAIIKRRCRLSMLTEKWNQASFAHYHIFQTARRTKNPLIFSKMESVAYNPVQLMDESGCAFSLRTNFMW